MRKLAYGLIVVPLVLVLRQSSGATCCPVAAVADVATAAQTLCTCCVVPKGGPRRRCVRRVAKLAVRAHTLPRDCAERVLEAVGGTCTPEASAACQPQCATDADCDDGNSCTADRCFEGRCGYSCLCVGSTGRSSCCPGPAAECPPLAWYYTCGDPVCRGHRDRPGVARCGPGQAPGTACTPEGKTCDPGSFCNETLVCATSDPTSTFLGCPISRARYKNDIRYLSAVDRRRVRDALLHLKLARYRYKGENRSAPTHLGFIIDDAGVSPAVAPNGNMVDLYGYASMAVAAIQTQAREIADLQHQVEALRRQFRDDGGARARYGGER